MNEQARLCQIVWQLWVELAEYAKPRPPTLDAALAVAQQAVEIIGDALEKQPVVIDVGVMTAFSRA